MVIYLECGKYESHPTYDRGMQTVNQLLDFYKSLKELHQYKKNSSSDEGEFATEERVVCD